MESKNYQTAIEKAAQQTISGGWNDESAVELFEAALARALKADPQDAPFPLTGEAAKTWHAGQASALQWVLEMLPQPFAREDTYSSEMGAAANLYHASFPHAHSLPAQWQWSEVWKVMNAAKSIVKATQTHVLFEKGDVDAPDVIKDRNGDIVLGLCKVCGKGEAQLSEPCDSKG